MTVNTFAAYDSAKQRIALKKHTEADEAMVATWEVATKLITENKRLLLLAEDRKTQLDDAQSSVRNLNNRISFLESRGQPPVRFEDILQMGKSQACEK